MKLYEKIANKLGWELKKGEGRSSALVKFQRLTLSLVCKISLIHPSAVFSSFDKDQ